MIDQPVKPWKSKDIDWINRGAGSSLGVPCKSTAHSTAALVLLLAVLSSSSRWSQPAIGQVLLTASEIAPPLLESLISELAVNEQVRASLLTSVRSKDYRSAQATLLDLLTHNPEPQSKRAILILLGNLYYSAEDYSQAIIAWAKADALSPLDDKTRFQLAVTEIHQGRSNWARPQLTILAEKDKTNALYQYWLARLDYDAQQYPSAIQRLERAVKLEPGMARGYDLLGLCQDFEGNSQAAIQAYNIAVRLNRTSPHPSSWPPLDLAITLINEDRLAEAKSLLVESLRDDPGNFKAHFELGYVKEQAGDMQGALDSLTTAANLDSTYAAPHYAMARVYRKLGKSEESTREVEIFKGLNRGSSPNN